MSTYDLIDYLMVELDTIIALATMTCIVIRKIKNLV